MTSRFHYYVTFMVCATVLLCVLMLTQCQRHQDELFPDARHIGGPAPIRNPN